jgi:hypothetical protein
LLLTTLGRSRHGTVKLADVRADVRADFRQWEGIRSTKFPHTNHEMIMPLSPRKSRLSAYRYWKEQLVFEYCVYSTCRPADCLQPAPTWPATSQLIVLHGPRPLDSTCCIADKPIYATLSKFASSRRRREKYKDSRHSLDVSSTWLSCLTSSRSCCVVCLQSTSADLLNWTMNINLMAALLYYYTNRSVCIY